MFTRQQERRKGEHANSLGRRQSRRYVLNDKLTATIYHQGNACVTGSILDISTTGAYLIASFATWQPQEEETLMIEFTETGTDKDNQIQSSIKYINKSFLLGGILRGMGVHFKEPLDGSIFHAAPNFISLFGANHDITHQQGPIKCT